MPVECCIAIARPTRTVSTKGNTSNAQIRPAGQVLITQHRTANALAIITFSPPNNKACDTKHNIEEAKICKAARKKNEMKSIFHQHKLLAYSATYLTGDTLLLLRVERRTPPSLGSATVCSCKCNGVSTDSLDSLKCS